MHCLPPRSGEAWPPAWRVCGGAVDMRRCRHEAPPVGGSGVGGPSPKWLGAGPAAARRGRSAREALEGHLPRRPAPPPHRRIGYTKANKAVGHLSWSPAGTSFPPPPLQRARRTGPSGAAPRPTFAAWPARSRPSASTPAPPRPAPSSSPAPLTSGPRPETLARPYLRPQLLSAQRPPLAATPAQGGGDRGQAIASQPLSASAPGAAPRWRRRGPGRCRRRRPAPGRSSPQHRAQPAALALAVRRSPAGAPGPAP